MALLNGLGPLSLLTERYGAQTVPLSDDPSLDAPFVAYDERKVLRLVRPPVPRALKKATTGDPPPPSAVEVTLAGACQLREAYSVQTHQGPHFSMGLLSPFPNFLLFPSFHSTLRQYRVALSGWESGLLRSPISLGGDTND